MGYAQVSTAGGEDLTAQRQALTALGVDPKRIYVDHGLTGTNRARPGLREALAACRAGDTLVVSKLDRLARSVPDARHIVDDLTARGVKLNIGGSCHLATPDFPHPDGDARGQAPRLRTRPTGRRGNGVCSGDPWGEDVVRTKVAVHDPALGSGEVGLQRRPAQRWHRCQAPRGNR